MNEQTEDLMTEEQTTITVPAVSGEEAAQGTDRLVALEKELSKLGAEIRVTDHSLHLEAPSESSASDHVRSGSHIRPNVSIDTYDDHRMAMAFAPLALRVPININDAEVVSKSYTDFWSDFESVIQV